MLIAKLIRYLRDKNEANISAGRNRLSGIGSKIVSESRWLRDKVCYKDIKEYRRVGDYAFFKKSNPSFAKNKSRSNMQVNWTTTESHRFSSTFKILLFVSMPP